MGLAVVGVAVVARLRTARQTRIAWSIRSGARRGGRPHCLPRGGLGNFQLRPTCIDRQAEQEQMMVIQTQESLSGFIATRRTA